MRLEVEITKARFLAICFLITLLIAIVGVYAYSSGTFSKTKSQSIIFGHSADEMVVNITGQTYTLQEAIDMGKLVSSTATGVVVGGCYGTGSGWGKASNCGSCGGSGTCSEGNWTQTGNGNICATYLVCCGNQLSWCQQGYGTTMTFNAATTPSCPSGWTLFRTDYYYYPAGQCIK